MTLPNFLTRQQAVFFSLIENFKEAEGAMSRMEGSAGELQKAYDEYMKSAEAHINQFKAAFEELAMSFVKSDFITEIVDIGRELVELLSKFTALINTLGGLKTVLIGVGAALIGMKFSAIIGWITKMASGFGVILKLLPSMRLALLSNEAAMTGLGISAESAAAAMSILKTAAIGLVAGGIMLLVNYINKQKEAREAEQRAAEEAVRASKESLANNTERIKSLIDLRNEYLNIVDGEDSYAKKTQELNKWKQTLIETYGLEKDAIDKVNLSRETGLGLIDEEIDKDIDTAIAEATAAYNDALNKMNGKITQFMFDDEDLARQVSGILQSYYGQMPYYEELLDGFDREYLVSTYINDTKAYLDATEKLINDLEKKKISGNLTHAEGIILRQLSESFGSYNEEYKEALDIIEKYNKLLARRNISDMQIDFGGITTKEQFDALKNEMHELYGENEAVLNQMYNIVNEAFPAFSQAETDVSNRTSLLGINFESLTEKIKGISDAYSLLETAEKEMEEGGLSVDTIKSMSEANKDYLDYLYEENGVIKLNTDAWLAYIAAKAKDNVDSLQATKDALLKERDIIQANIDAINGKLNSINDTSQFGVIGQAAFQSALDAERQKLEENSKALLENQIQLSLFSEQYLKATESVYGFKNAYDEALGNFPSVKDTIDEISGSFKTLADIQNEVADGFTISLDKALEFASVYPQILDSAEPTADGQIRLNEEVVNSFIDGKEAELRAEIDARIKELETEKSVQEAKMTFAKAQLEIAKSVGEGEGQISLALAEYKLNLGNQVAQALINAGIDEASAYKLAYQAMAGNAQEFNRVAMEVCRDVDGNFNKAAYNAAMAIYRNMTRAKQDIASVAMQAQLAAAAIAGAAAGITAGYAKPLSGSGGGVYSGGYSMNMSSGSYNGVDYTYSPQTVKLDKFIADLGKDIESYSNAIKQIDGQIATLQALRNTDLSKYKSDSGSSSGSGSGGGRGSSGSGSGSSGNSEADNWFEREYKLHNHLLKMDAEQVEDYLVWLNDAYKRAYKEGLITLDDYYKY